MFIFDLTPPPPRAIKPHLMPARTKNPQTDKLTIMLSPDAHEYARARAESFNKRISRYIQSLIEQEMYAEADIHGHNAAVLKKAKRIWPKSKEGDGNPLIAISGQRGVVTALRHIEGNHLWALLVKWAQAAKEHGLNELWVVLPDDCKDSDVVNFAVLGSSGAFEALKVCRLKNFSGSSASK